MEFFPFSLFSSSRRQTVRESGYVPANYVKEIEPRIIKKMAKETVLVPEITKVKKKVKKKIQVEKKRLGEPKRKPAPSSPRLSRNRSMCCISALFKLFFIFKNQIIVDGSHLLLSFSCSNEDTSR